MLSLEQIQRLLDIANSACQKGLVHEARTIYDAVITLKPEHAPAHIGKAFSHIIVDEFEAGHTELNDVLEKNPDDTDALTMRGLSYLLEKRNDEAIEILDPVANGESSAAELAKGLLEQAKA